jgi:3-oxoacyl-(acyl-carrier-protein) synthase
VRSVVVTGLGVVSPFGAGVKAFWEGISGGSCAIRPITLIDTEGFRCQIAAEVPGEIAGSARRSRADRLGLAAAREALDDAGIVRVERADAALIVGAVGGGMLETEA